MQRSVNARVAPILISALCCPFLPCLSGAERKHNALISETHAAADLNKEDGERTSVLENEKVKIWSVTLTPHNEVSIGSGKEGSLMLLLKGGKLKTTSSREAPSTATRQAGDAIYIHAGYEQTEEVVSENPVPLYLVELKGGATTVVANRSGFPLAYPRPGSKKILENDRVIVWNYTYALGKKTAMHFHDKDAVVIFRFAGSIDSTTPDGQSTVTDDKAGEVRFSRANRVHSEELVKGQESVIVVEIK